MNTPILDMLEAQELSARFCMPGHKGRFKFKEGWDITEIRGADNLAAPRECIAESQNLCADENGAAHAFYSVNGSTACVLAALGYLPRGSKVIAARDFHVSFANAARMFDFTPCYVGVELSTAHSPSAVSGMCEAIAKNHDAAAVYLTYPNYYGNCADLSAICNAAHDADMLVIVDAAHGAHLGFSNQLPPSPSKCGADIWNVSAHKTLPAPNQSAILFCSKRVDAEHIKRCLNSVQTTSPSYPILAGLDYARAFMAKQGKSKLESLIKSISELDIDGITGLRLRHSDDKTKVCIDFSKRGISGFEAEEKLFERGIVVETADEHSILLITTVFDTEQDFSLLKEALISLPFGKDVFPEITYKLETNIRLTPFECAALPSECVLLEKAVGRITAGNAFVYPPGVPILMEGCEISAEAVEAVSKLIVQGYNVLNGEYVRVFK